MNFALFALMGLAMTAPPSAKSETATTQERWTIQRDGGILWDIAKDTRLPHNDKIETSGLRASAIVTYGVDTKGILTIRRDVVFPLLRTIPNNTHASLIWKYTDEQVPHLMMNSAPVVETLVSMKHRGLMEFETRTPNGLKIKRTLFVSRTLPALLEHIEVKNTGKQRIALSIAPASWRTITPKENGVSGSYVVSAHIINDTPLALNPKDKTSFTIVYTAQIEGETPPKIEIEKEIAARRDYVDHLRKTLVFSCPDPAIERMFAFAKIRAAESICATKSGLMHSPGGYAYYAAIWANDQAEYANPFFAYLGDENGVLSARNAFRQFARFINPEYKPIPSSIIAEGTDTWQGAGDRGDMAMIAYGAGRFALARGDKETARQLLPLINWCLTYLDKQLSADGVIHSDSDELEGRFPAGKYNLNTSSLTYDALLSASYLARDLGESNADVYAQRAAKLRRSIEKFFGAELFGFPTYRYYEGNTTLRAWIATPLCMDIFDRSKGTLDALFSDYLWTPDGIRSEMKSETYWDRATLYAMRGALNAGAANRVLPYLAAYSRRRLLGDHVPYAIEAYPEGDQRHLSAESALYCRVIVEGLFGYRPTGLDTFVVRPHLPTGWKTASLKQFRSAGGVCDLTINMKNGTAELKVSGEGYKAKRLPNGDFKVMRSEIKKRP